MSTLTDTRTPHHPASQNPVDAGGLTIDEVIPHLVGRTIDEVERELILHTLIRCCGSRTRSANILGISIRCMRNKIHAYEDIGISVARPESLVSGDRASPELQCGHAAVDFCKSVEAMVRPPAR